jgi:hypothetical protein
MEDPNVPSASLPAEAIESVETAKYNTTAGGTTFATNMMNNNMVGHVARLQGIFEAATGKIIESIIATDAKEAGADVALLQQLLKGAQTTLPQTGSGG